MKKDRFSRWIGAVLALCLALTLVPATTFAAENAFCLVAEGGGKLVIEPEWVTYTPGQTVKEALAASGHNFVGLTEGMIYEIDGVPGRYTRSDQDGGYALDAPAAGVTLFRFSENGESRPSEALGALMREMADYQKEPEDVRLAAKNAYETAKNRFVGANDSLADELMRRLKAAVDDYHRVIDGKTYPLTFTDGAKPYSVKTCPGVVITAENAFGRTYTDADGDGTLKLPQGSYTFCLSADGRHISGETAVSGAKTIAQALPEGQWLNTETLELSTAYGDDFAAGLVTLESTGGRAFDAQISDAFSGSLYVYADYDPAVRPEGGELPTLTLCYRRTDGEQIEKATAFLSRRDGADRVLTRGGQGSVLTLRVGTKTPGGLTLSLDYPITLRRTPTLKSLTVLDEKGTPQAATTAFSPSVHAYTYKVLSTVNKVTVKPLPQAPGYAVTVNGQPSPAEGVTVPLNRGGDGKSAETLVTVTVQAGEFTGTYTLKLCPGQGQRITFNTTADDVVMEVRNRNGELLHWTRERQLGSGFYAYLYTLVPGEDYSYIARKDSFYTEGRFTIEQSAGSTITVPMRMKDLATDLNLGQTVRDRDVELSEPFSPAVHSYTAAVRDDKSGLFAWMKTGAQDADMSVIYTQKNNSERYDGVKNTVAIPHVQKKGVNLVRALQMRSPEGSTVVFRLSRQGREEDGQAGLTFYQDYTVEVKRQLTLKALDVRQEGVSLVLTQTADPTQTGYAPAVQDYTVTVPAAARELAVSAETHPDSVSSLRFGETTNGYHAFVNGVQAEGTVSVPLSGDLTPETVTVTVRSDKVPGTETVYTIHVQKGAPVHADFITAPEQAVLAVQETGTHTRCLPENGSILLSEGYDYRFTLTAPGYRGQGGSLSAVRGGNGELLVEAAGKSFPVTEKPDGTMHAEIALTLEKAPENPEIDHTIPSEWADFRGTSYTYDEKTQQLVPGGSALSNNGVVDYRIPFAADKGELQWFNQLGSGYSGGAVGCPILVDGDLITYSGNILYRLDSISGEVLASGTMDHASDFSITPPTYSDGMIFMALSNGTVQAFDAVTLESLWSYKDPLGGQPNSPMTVRDGRLYTGFWNNETLDADFVCLTVTDEDPSRPDEEKHACWQFTQKGGFYWAGAYVGEDFLLVGTDDGRSGYTSHSANLLMLDPKTGLELDRWNGLCGDVRSSVCYDAAGGGYYFTSKGGYFYGVRVERTESGPRLGERWSVFLQNGSSNPAMSTSTPVVHNGRAYIGVSGESQFANYSGHSITVIDLASRRIAYSVPTMGYPQTSGLLTTAYAGDADTVYVYFFDNMAPGKLRVLRDHPGQNKPDYVTREEGLDTGYVLFTPVGDDAQFAICSPIADACGTIFYKNDTGRIMAFGSRARALTVTRAPDKTVYAPGEIFDPAGMIVTLTYENGLTREVTKYVQFPDTPLQAGDTSVTLRWPFVQYHNQDEEGGVSRPGVTSVTPVTQVPISMGGSSLKAERAVMADAQTAELTLTGRQLDKPAELVLAAYEKDTGRMLTLGALNAPTLEGEHTFRFALNAPLSAENVYWKLFVLSADGSMTPMMKALPVAVNGK